MFFCIFTAFKNSFKFFSKPLFLISAGNESASAEAADGESSDGRDVVGRDVGEAAVGRRERGQGGRQGELLSNF